jgi:acetyl esterase/lipase
LNSLAVHCEKLQSSLQFADTTAPLDACPLYQLAFIMKISIKQVLTLIQRMNSLLFRLIKKRQSVWALSVVLFLGGLIPSFSSSANLTEKELAEKYSASAWAARRIYQDILVSSVGSGEKRAYIFQPDAENLSKLPVVLFLHGWRGTNPKNFGALIDLMVRRGAVVIYPVYQEEGEKTSPQRIAGNAAESIQAAFAMLEKNQPQLIDKSKTLYWGFSMGASLSMRFALQSPALGLPKPTAMVLVGPGEPHHVVRGAAASPITGDIESLSPTIPTFIITGNADNSIGVPTARAWSQRLCHLPSTHRKLLLLPSDGENGQRIAAGHGSPGAPDSRFDFPDATQAVPPRIKANRGFEESPSLNQLDFYGYWRVSMAMLDYVAGGAYPLELFLPQTLENKFLGLLPSGRPYAAAMEEDLCR